MNWFKLISLFVGVGSVVADNFVKNPDSKRVKSQVMNVINTVLEGLANQNPDGTPASQPYSGPPASVDKVIETHLPEVAKTTV